jgi:hypothetical protein
LPKTCAAVTDAERERIREYLRRHSRFPWILLAFIAAAIALVPLSPSWLAVAAFEMLLLVSFFLCLATYVVSLECPRCLRHHFEPRRVPFYPYSNPRHCRNCSTRLDTNSLRRRAVPGTWSCVECGWVFQLNDYRSDVAIVRCENCGSDLQLPARPAA